MPPALWHDIVDMYLTWANNAHHAPKDAMRLYCALASLAPNAPRLDTNLRRRALTQGRDLLAYCIAQNDDPTQLNIHEVWAAVQVLCAPTILDMTPFIRRHIRDNRLSEATYLLDEYVRACWEHGTRPPSRGLMHTLMIQMMVVERVLWRRPVPAKGQFGASQTLFEQYAVALARVGALLAQQYLPLVASDKEDIAWLVKLLTTFPKLGYDTSRVREAATTIHAALPSFLAYLPSGQPMPADYVPQRTSRIDRAQFLLPVLNEPTYNALMHYTFERVDRPEWCRQLLEHMTQLRCPPLYPDPVTINILFRQSMQRRMYDLGLYALELGTDAPHETALDSSGTRIRMHLADALTDDDPKRVWGIVRHMCTASASLDSSEHLTSVVRLMYPELRLTHPEPCKPFMRRSYFYVMAMRLAARAQNMPLMFDVYRLCKQVCVSQPRPMPRRVATTLMRLLDASVSVPKHQDVFLCNEDMHDVRFLALQEYAWVMQHNRKLHAPLPVGVYVPLLRLLRRTSRRTPGADSAYARVVNDIYTMKIAHNPRLEQMLADTKMTATSK